jgi:hypothetical protein
VKKTAPFYLFTLIFYFIMKTEFHYSFAKSKREKESPQLDIEAVLESIMYIVCPYKRIARRRDDMENAVVYLFHNAVPHVAIYSEHMAGSVTIKEIKPVERVYEGAGTQILYHGRMDYESVHLTKHHKKFTRDTNLDAYFSIHMDDEGRVILYIGSQNTKI